MEKNEISTQLLGLALHLCLLIFQVLCVIVLYHYYQYGGLYRPKTSIELFVAPADPIYLIVTLALLPPCFLTFVNVTKQLMTILKTRMGKK